MLNFLKPLSFLPAILMMYLIFTFSSQDGVTSAQLSYKVSYKIVEVGGKLLGANFEPQEIDNLTTRFHGVIRKIAHMAEYFLLAVAVAFPLYVYGLRGILLMIVAGLFCVAFACTDEYHQASVAGRGPSQRDVLIDSFGIFWGIVLVRIVGWTGRKTIFRPFGRKKKKLNQQPYPNATYQNVPHQQQPYQPTASYYPPRDGSVPPQPGAYRNQPSGYPPQPGAYWNQPSDYPPQPGAYRNQPSGYPPQPGTYRGQPPFGPPPYPPYGYPPADTSSKHNTTSDRLSEDMSLKKLMKDLREQKAEQKNIK